MDEQEELVVNAAFERMANHFGDGDMDERDAQFIRKTLHGVYIAALTPEAADRGDGRLDQVTRLEEELATLKSERDHPETEDFFKGVPLEAAHQRSRWPSEHDAGKTPADWFWLVGYLAGKCLAAHIARNQEKALHHTISTAAALANWHLAIKGKTDMRPGIDSPTESATTPEEQGAPRNFVALEI